MEWKGSLYAGAPILADVPVYGAAANIIKGAAVMRGTTLGTDLNFAIVATGSAVDIIGVLDEAHTNTTAGDDTNATGTNYTLRKCIIDPFALFRAEFDQDDTMAVLSSSGTTVNVTSGETNMQGGYLYAVGGTGAGRLALVTTDNGSGAYTTKETTGWDSSTTLIKIVPKWHQLIKLSANASEIGTDAAAGSATVSVRDTWIQASSIPLQRLNPVTHSGLTGLNSVSVKFFADIIFRNHELNTID